MWWSSYSFYFVYSVFKGENPTYVILFKKNNKNKQTKNCNIGLYSDNYSPISLKLGMMIDHWGLHFDIGLDDLYLLQGHRGMRKKNEPNLGVHFLAEIDLDEIQYVGTTWWFVEAHVKFILLKGDSLAAVILWNIYV